jgi:hypothetical protein
VLPNETFQVEVVDELVAEFQKEEEWRSRLERPGMRIYDLPIGPPSGRARLANRLDDAIGHLGVKQVARWEVDAELDALRTSTARFWDLVLDMADGPSSLAVSLSIAAELLEGHVDAAAANGVRCGTQSALVATLLHFSELETELELLGSGRNAVLMEDQVDSLWIQACLASDLLALHVLPVVARNPLDGVGE